MEMNDFSTESKVLSIVTMDFANHMQINNAKT